MKLTTSKLTFNDGNEILKDEFKTLKVDNFATNKKLFQGDHWRDGMGWTGPKPDPSKTNVLGSIMQRIKRQFVSKNVVREIIKRHVNSVFGNSPTVNFVPNRMMKDDDEISEEEQSQINEIQHAITEWMRDKSVLTYMKRGLGYSLYGSRSVLRFYIPSGHLDSNGRLEEVETLSDALDKIYLDVGDPDFSAVMVDEDTKRKVGVFKGKDREDDKDFIEISFVVIPRDLIDEEDDSDMPDEPDEIFTEANKGMSFIVTIKKGESEFDRTEPMALHGEISMYQMDREPLISSSIVQNQDLLNKTLTMWSANLDWSGFVERIILNGMPPGEWKRDEETHTLKYEQIGELETGPSTTAFISGVPKFDDQGQITGAETPHVVFRDPINPETFNVTRKTSYLNILEEAHQSHILLQAQTEASGISRREARQDYMDDLSDSKQVVDLAGNWMLNTALFLAQWLMGAELSEPEFRSDFSCNVKAGAVAKDDIEILSMLKENGWISDETAMSRAGIDDVEGEKSRIDTVFDRVQDIMDMTENSSLHSPTLMKELMKMILEDVDILIQLDESVKKAIIDEVGQSADRKSEENDFMAQIRGN